MGITYCSTNFESNLRNDLGNLVKNIFFYNFSIQFGYGMYRYFVMSRMKALNQNTKYCLGYMFTFSKSKKRSREVIDSSCAVRFVEHNTNAFFLMIFKRVQTSLQIFNSCVRKSCF
uniref:Uncharacterized protein n=1 Tax=Lepeophtheirus salmonis TaxID=72036 RepID=A0A0K2T190_LEPSM